VFETALYTINGTWLKNELPVVEVAMLNMQVPVAVGGVGWQNEMPTVLDTPPAVVETGGKYSKSNESAGLPAPAVPGTRSLPHTALMVALKGMNSEYP
jgi:hypothetical protein